MEDGDDPISKCAPDRVGSASQDPDHEDHSKIPLFVFDRRPSDPQLANDQLGDNQTGVNQPGDNQPGDDQPDKTYDRGSIRDWSDEDSGDRQNLEVPAPT